MIPVVDKPAIQYVVEEAVRAGITDILLITGRGKRTLEEMLDVHERTGSSVIALKEFPPSEISSYGCAAVDHAEDGVVRLTDIVEKPAADEAPSNLAVMGRYVLTPAIFAVLDEVKPGKGGEIQLTDAIRLLMQQEPVYGFSFVHGRFDVGNKVDYLRATVELALERDDLGPPFREFLRGLAHREQWS